MRVRKKGTMVANVQPFSADQSKEGRKSLQNASCIPPSPTGSIGNSIYTKCKQEHVSENKIQFLLHKNNGLSCPLQVKYDISQFIFSL